MWSLLLLRWTLKKEAKEQENKTGGWESAWGADGEDNNEVMKGNLPGEAHWEQMPGRGSHGGRRELGGCVDPCGCHLAGGREYGEGWKVELECWPVPIMWVLKGRGLGGGNFSEGSRKPLQFYGGSDVIWFAFSSLQRWGDVGDQGFGVHFGGGAYLQDFAVLEYRARARERPRRPRAMKPPGRVCRIRPL